MGLIMVVFVGLIAFPWVNGRLHFVKDLPSKEKRQLEDAPSWNLDSLESYPKHFDQYFSDHLSVRFRLINWYGQLQYRVFDASPIPNRVIIGRDGWFFLAADEQNSYTGKWQFNDEELEKLRLELTYRNDFVERNGGKFYFMIIPSKNNIYSEKMKRNVVREHDQSWGEHIYADLRKKSKIKLIDIVPVLQRNHELEMTYYKLDNHWNEWGAFHAANEVLAVIHEDFPTVHPNLISDYSIERIDLKKGNLVEMFGLELPLEDSTVKMHPINGFQAQVIPDLPYPVMESFVYPDHYETRRAIECSQQPKILLFTDSFGELFMPFAAEQFRETVKIFDGWEYKLNEPIVQNEHADVVLLMILESNLRHILDHMSYPEAAEAPSSTTP